MADIKKFAEELVNLTVKDVQELAKVLKEEYGIEPAAAAAVVAAPAAGGEAAAAAEKTEFDVILKSSGTEIRRGSQYRASTADSPHPEILEVSLPSLQG